MRDDAWYKNDLLERLCYDPETGKINWKVDHGGREALCGLHQLGYLYGRVYKKAFYAHRVAWLLHYGDWPEGEIDHINGNRADNRLCNLRDIPKDVNAKNKRMSSRNKTGYNGVCFNKRNGKYLVQVGSKGFKKFSAHYETLDEAVRVRREKEAEFGYHVNHGSRS